MWCASVWPSFGTNNTGWAIEGLSGTRDNCKKSGTVLEILGELEPMHSHDLTDDSHNLLVASSQYSALLMGGAVGVCAHASRIPTSCIIFSNWDNIVTLLWSCSWLNKCSLPRRAGKGRQLTSTWDLEHSIEHAYLCHPVGALCYINQNCPRNSLAPLPTHS